MDTPSELARNAHYESLDSNLPHCHECGKSEREVRLVWCGARHCDNSICENCATKAQWELEACSVDCECSIALDMVDREAKLRHQVHQLRREARSVRRAAAAERQVA